MDEYLRRFAAAHRRDVAFCNMVDVTAHGEERVELHFISETGQPVVLRLGEESAGWFRACVRDYAAKHPTPRAE